MVTGEVSFGLALAGGWAGGNFAGTGLGGSGAVFFSGCCSGVSEEGRLIPAMPPTGRMEEGNFFKGNIMKTHRFRNNLQSKNIQRCLVGNMESTQGDTDFLHEQCCTGLRGKRQQVNLNDILKLLIFLFSGNVMKRNAEVKKCKSPSINGENKTLDFQFQPRVWLELILTETGPAGTGRGVMAKELKHRGFASFKLLCSRLPTQPEHPLLQGSTLHPSWDSLRANNLVECANDH